MENIANILEALRTRRNKYIRQRDWQKALDAIDHMIDLYPTPSHYTRRGMVLIRMRKFAEARENLRKALALRPGYEKAKDILVRLAADEETVAEGIEVDLRDHVESLASDNEAFANASVTTATMATEVSDSVSDEKNLEPSTAKIPRQAASGETFGRYRIIREIGRGGMGSVYKAYDPQLDRVVALKLLLYGSENSRRNERFLREAKAIARLHHPNIVAVHDIGQEQQAYFTMDFIHGYSLKIFCQKNSPGVREIVELVLRAGEALDYAHREGVVHRDIKPSNIMVDEYRQPKIMDFGLAKVSDSAEDLSKTGDVLGTPAYMSPEQAQGRKIDARTDVYSLGATLYEILTGKPPFYGESHFNVIYQILEQEPIPPRELNPDVPVDLEAICLKCLEKKADRRYQDTRSLVEDLRRFLDHKPVVAKPVTAFSHFQKFLLRHRTLVAAVLLAFIGISLGGAFACAKWLQAKEARDKLSTLQQKSAQSAKESRLILARIALKKAEEAYEIEDWAQCGSYAGTALEFVREYQDEESIAMREQGNDLVQWSLRRYGLLWETPWHAMVRKVLYSPDGKTLASFSYSSNVKLWDARTGTLLHTLQLAHSVQVEAIVYTPDGTALAAAGDKILQLWAVNTGKSLGVIYEKALIKSLAFSKKDQTLAVGNVEGYIHLYDISGELEREFLAHQGEVLSIAFSDDGRYLASCSTDHSIKLWDVGTGKILKTLTGHASTINKIVFFANGQRLASASLDKKVKVWDVGEGKCISEYADHTHEVNAIAISSDEKYLASLDQADAKARIWNIVSGKQVAVLSQRGSAALAFSPDSEYLLTSNKGQQLQHWHISNSEYQQSEAGHSLLISSVVFQPNGEIVASSGHDKTIKLWNTTTGDIIDVVHTDAEISEVAFSPDGTELAAALRDNSIKLWDTATRKEISTLTGHSGDVFCVAFAPQLHWLASGSKDKTIRLWDRQGRNILLEGHQNSVEDIAFSPDGTLLVSASEDGTVRIWNAKEGKQQQILYKHGRGARTVSFNRDGTFLVASFVDDTIKLWKSDNWQEYYSQQHYTRDRFAQAVFTPDGTAITVANKEQNLQLWDIASRKIVRTLPSDGSPPVKIAFNDDGRILAYGHHALQLWQIEAKQPVATLPLEKPEDIRNTVTTFSPDGQLLAAVFRGNIVRLWNGDGSRHQSDCVGHKDAVTSLTFAPDSKTLASASKDGTARIWNIQGQELVKLTKSVDTIAYSHNGEQLAFVSNGRELRLCSAQGVARQLIEMKESINKAALSSDGTILATTSWERENKVQLWNLTTAQFIREISREIHCFAFSPDNTSLVTASANAISLWNIANGEQIWTVSITRNCRGIAFTSDGQAVVGLFWKEVQRWRTTTGEQLDKLPLSFPLSTATIARNGRTLAFVNREQIANVWEIGSDKPPIDFTGHTRRIYITALSSDGRFLATASEDKVIKLWEIATGRELATLEGHSDSIHDLAFSSSGHLVASASMTETILWQVDSGRKLQEFAGYSQPLLFLPKSDEFLASCTPSSIQFYDLSTAKLQKFLEHSVRINSFVLHPRQPIFAYACDEKIQLYNIETRQKIRELVAENKVHRLVFTPDGETLVSVSADDIIASWDLASGQRRDFIKPSGLSFVATAADTENALFSANTLVSIAMGPEGKILASVDFGEPIRLWDIATGKQLRQFETAQRQHYFISFSPDGRTLVTSFISNLSTEMVSLWDARNGRCIKVFADSRNAVFSYNPSFHPGGRWLVCPAAKEINIWDVSFGQKNPTTHPFAFRADISGEIIASKLRQTPREITQQLFARRVTDVFANEPALNIRLWGSHRNSQP